MENIHSSRFYETLQTVQSSNYTDLAMLLIPLAWIPGEPGAKQENFVTAPERHLMDIVGTMSRLGYSEYAIVGTADQIDEVISTLEEARASEVFAPLWRLACTQIPCEKETRLRWFDHYYTQFIESCKDSDQDSDSWLSDTRQ